MELRLLINLLKKNVVAILLVCLATTVGAAGYTLRRPISYDIAVALVTNYEGKNVSENAAPYYRFDGFYAFQAAERFSQVVVGVLKSANAASEIYQRAGIPLEATSISALSKMFKPQKTTERVVEVTFSATSKEEGGKLAKALAEFMNVQAQIASKASKEGSFSVAVSEPVVLKTTSHLLIWTLIGLLGGFGLSVSFVVLIYYFKEDE